MEVDANCDGNYKLKQYAVPVLYFVKDVIESEEEGVVDDACDSGYAPYGCGGAKS